MRRRDRLFLLLLIFTAPTYTFGQDASSTQLVLRQNYLDNALSSVVVPSTVTLIDAFVQSIGDPGPFLTSDLILKDIELPVTCSYAFVFLQKVKMVCSSALDEKTFIDFFVPELRASIIRAGEFSFECVVPNCVRITSQNKRLVASDGFMLAIEARFTNSVVSIIQEYRGIIPLVCNPLETSC